MALTSKMPKAPLRKSGTKARHDPLHVQLKEDENFSKYGKVSKPGKRTKKQSGSGDENEEVRHTNPNLKNLL